MPNDEEIKEVTPEMLSEYKESFKNLIKDPFSNYKDNSLKELLKREDEKEILEVFAAAVAQGYDDAKRTFTGISQVWESDETRKSSFFTEIAEKIYEVFKNTSTEFDVWHKDACVFFRNKLNQMTDSERNPYNKATYGQAQKVINMTFKYLYCMKDADYYHDIFDKCHMPLDSFTLEWYRRYVCKDYIFEKNSKAKLKSDTVWSKLVQEEYTAITALINAKLSSKDKPLSFKIGLNDFHLPTQPLYTEFIIWPEMQMHIAAEEFLFTFGNHSISDKKKIKDSPDLLAKLYDITEEIRYYQRNLQKSLMS